MYNTESYNKLIDWLGPNSSADWGGEKLGGWRRDRWELDAPGGAKRNGEESECVEGDDYDGR